MKRHTALLAVGAVLAGLPIGLAGSAPAAASSSGPIVTGLTPPAGNPSGGDTITIVGHGFSRATSVHFGSALSSQVTVVSSTKVKVVTPQHALGTVMLRVETKGGSQSPRTDSARFSYANPPAPLKWSQPADFDPVSLYNGYVDISCATKQVCLAVPARLDAQDPAAPVMLNNGSWRRVDLPPSASGAFTQASTASCPLPNMCVVVGWSDTPAERSPTAWIWNGTDWSLSLQEPVGTSPWRRPVCARGYEYCLVADSDGVVQIYDGGQWTTSAQQFYPISCTSDTFCIVLTATGYAIWNGSIVGPGEQPFGDVSPAVSCATSNFCLAIGRDNNQILQWTFDGSTWSTVDSPDLTGTTTVPACPTPTSCWLATFDDGISRGAHFDGRSWTQGKRIASRQQTFLSCWSADGCRSVDHGGNIHTFATGQWRTAQPIPRTGIPTDVSCASATMCMAVDRTGHALRFDGTAWQPPEPIDIHRQVLSVSCPAARFCMAIDNRGYTVRYDRGRWNKPTHVLSLTHGSETTDVSCASSAFCVAVVRDGRAAVYSNGRWRETPRTVQQNGNVLNAVSCTTPGRCVAVGAGMSIYDGHWNRSMADSHTFSDVSCVGKTCAAASRQLWMRSGGVLAATGVHAFGRAVCGSRHFCLYSDSQDAGAVAADGASAGDAHIPGETFLAGDCTKRFCMLLVPSPSYLQFQETHAAR